MDEHRRKTQRSNMFLKYKTESALRNASLRKIPKFDVLFSGTRLLLLLLVLVGWLVAIRPAFLFKHHYVSVEFRHLAFPYQPRMTERTRKFYPIYELQFILRFPFLSFALHQYVYGVLPVREAH